MSRRDPQGGSAPAPRPSARTTSADRRSDRRRQPLHRSNGRHRRGARAAWSWSTPAATSRAVRNAGAATATGEILVTIDADSIMAAEALVEIERQLETGRYVGGGCKFMPERTSLGIATTLAITWLTVAFAATWRRHVLVFAVRLPSHRRLRRGQSLAEDFGLRSSPARARPKDASPMEEPAMCCRHIVPQVRPLWRLAHVRHDPRSSVDSGLRPWYRYEVRRRLLLRLQRIDQREFGRLAAPARMVFVGRRSTRVRRCGL